MKKFIVDTGKKKYSVEANDVEHAVELVKTIDDEASQLQTVNALIEDEKAAVEAYDVAIENLRGKIPEESLQAIIAIRDDENRHIENLQAVVNGTVTEKNLEDSKIALSDTNLSVGKTYNSKSGHKLTVKKINASYSDYDGSPEVSIDYDFEKADGKKGSSKCSTRDFFKMLQDSMMNDNNAYVIFKQNGEWKGTSEENYNARIQNARAIVTFKGMRNKEEVIEYVNKYMGGMNNIRIIDSANEYAIYETANMRKKVKVLYKGNKLSTIELNGEKKDVSTKCLTFVKDVERKNKDKDSTVNDMGMWVPSKKRNYNEYNMSLSPDKLEIKLKAGMSGNVDRTIIEGAIRETIGDLKEVMSNKSLDQSGVDNVKQVYRDLAKQYQGKLYSTNANEALDDLLRLVR